MTNGSENDNRIRLFDAAINIIRVIWLQAAGGKLQALIGACYRLPAIIGINGRACELDKFKKSRLKKY